MKKRRPYKVGLTGSIGMGKTTTAKMFADLGIPVWDADKAVARLYAPGGGGAKLIEGINRKAVVEGRVDKEALRQWIASDETALRKIEAIVHPLVRLDREAFLRTTKADIVVFDIPLLFETKADSEMDLVVVVSAPERLQQQRVLQREGMTQAQLDLILSKQMSDREKRVRADIVIPTKTLESARKAVESLVQKVRENVENA